MIVRLKLMEASYTWSTYKHKFQNRCSLFECSYSRTHCTCFLKVDLCDLAGIPSDEPSALRPSQDWRGEDPNASLNSSLVEAAKPGRGRSKRRRVSFPSPSVSPPPPPVGAPPATASTPAVSLQLQAEWEPEASLMEQKPISPTPQARSVLEERRRNSGRGRSRRGLGARNEVEAEAAPVEAEPEKENEKPEEEASGSGHVIQQLRKVGKRLGGSVGRRSMRRDRPRQEEVDVDAVRDCCSCNLAALTFQCYLFVFQFTFLLL